MALGMTLAGAEAGTFESMRSALRLGNLDREEVGAAYRSLIDLLSDLDPTVSMEIPSPGDCWFGALGSRLASGLQKPPLKIQNCGFPLGVLERSGPEEKMSLAEPQRTQREQRNH